MYPKLSVNLTNDFRIQLIILLLPFFAMGQTYSTIERTSKISSRYTHQDQTYSFLFGLSDVIKSIDDPAASKQLRRYKVNTIGGPVLILTGLVLMTASAADITSTGGGQDAGYLLLGSFVSFTIGVVKIFTIGRNAKRCVLYFNQAVAYKNAPGPSAQVEVTMPLLTFQF